MRPAPSLPGLSSAGETRASHVDDRVDGPERAQRAASRGEGLVVLNESDVLSRVGRCVLFGAGNATRALDA
eukprot:scaffold145597_cov136-Phaeocystis_antarctica.AAC.1